MFADIHHRSFGDVVTHTSGDHDQVFNRDVSPTDDLSKAYPGLAPLISNKVLAEAFAHHEKLAVRAKRDYVWLGRGALTLIFIGMSIFAYQLTLGQVWSVPYLMPIVGVIVLAGGVIAQMVLLTSGIKRKWLFNRFAAERIRCLKFQAFGLVETGDIAQLGARVSSFYEAGLARLTQELSGGDTAIMDFDPERPDLDDAVRGRVAWAESDVLNAMALYDSLRIGVQLQHCKSQIAEADDRRRAPLVLSDLLFLIGVLLGLTDLGWLAATAFVTGAEQLHGLAGALHFLTLAIFISSAITGVYQRGSTDTADIDRYREYVQDLERMRGRLKDLGRPVFHHVVGGVEWCALSELKGFARDASRSSYIV